MNTAEYLFFLSIFLNASAVLYCLHMARGFNIVIERFLEGFEGYEDE